MVPWGAPAGQPAQAGDPGAGLPVAVLVGTGAGFPDDAAPAEPVPADPLAAGAALLACPVAPPPADGAPEELAAPHPAAASVAIDTRTVQSATRALRFVMVIASFPANTI